MSRLLPRRPLPALASLLIGIAACAPAPEKQPEAGLPGFAGSASCAPCHAAASEAWRRTPHARTVRPLEDPDRELLSRSLLCSAESPALVLGERHARRYLVPAGGAPPRHRLLPCRYDVAEASWATVEPPAGGATTWEEGCAACHTTGFSSDSLSWTDLTVGCEACHGPADRHTGETPRGRMVAFASLEPAREVEVCAACHLQGGRSRATGRPFARNPIAGERLFEDLEFDWASLDAPAAPGESPVDHHQKILIRALARGEAGGLRCTSCHSVHAASHARHERLERQPFCYLCHETEGFQVKEYRQSCNVCEF